MTPSQAYAQWKQWGADPGDSNSRSIQKFSQQFGLDPEDEEELLEAYPDQPRYSAPKKSGFISQTFGAGTDVAQKGFGESLAGPGAKILEDFGWEGGARALEDIGGDIIEQQEKDLQEYEAPQTREELIKEGGFLGAVYEHILPKETHSPEQLGRSFMPSMVPAATALGAAGVAALAAPYVVPAALGWTGSAVFTGATAMAVGNATASFQVGGEEFENAKRDPEIRKQLGIDPDELFENLEPSQQSALEDSAQRVAKDTLVQRLYTSGALESLAFIPYGGPALRYIADIALGATSEELDKHLGIENTIVELERLGVSREEVPELRERLRALRPGTKETLLNAAIMEAVVGGPVTAIETVANKDDRVSKYASEKSKKQKLLEERAQRRIEDPEYMDPTQKAATKFQDELSENRRQAAKDERVRVFKNNKEADKLNQSEESGMQGDALDKANKGNQLDAEIDITPSKPAEGASAIEANPEDISSASFDEQTATLENLFEDDVVLPFDMNDENDISLGGHEHQSVLDTVNETIEGIDFIPAVWNPEIKRDENGNSIGGYEIVNANGDFVQIPAERPIEGFTYDLDPISPETGNPRVYITQHMSDPNTGAPIRSTKGAINRAIAVSFHEGITHTGLRQMLNAGEPKTITETVKDENGVERTQTKLDPSNEWTGDEYNSFIHGVRRRELKKIKRWLKTPAGAPYNNDSPFRQTEEWIARNFGETGGGRELGFFDNIAIALREAAPWLKNSFNQYQVAKLVQSAVNQRVKIEGDVKTAESNILSGTELVGAIVRAAAQSDLEADVVGEQVKVREPFLKIREDTGVAAEEKAAREGKELAEEQEASAEEKRSRFKATQKIGKEQEKKIKADEIKSKKKRDKLAVKALKEKTKIEEDTKNKINTATERISKNLENWEQYSIDKDISLDEEGKGLTNAERRGRTLGQSIIESRLYDKSPEIINEVINNIKGVTKAHKASALKQIGRKKPDLLTSELANILVPGSVRTAKGVRTRADNRQANLIIDYVKDKKKKLKKEGKKLPRKDALAQQSAQLFLKTDAKTRTLPAYTVPEDFISKSLVIPWAGDMPAHEGTTKADKAKWEAKQLDTRQPGGIITKKRKQEGKLTAARYINVKTREKSKLWKRHLDALAKKLLPLRDKEGKPAKMGAWERLFGLYVNNEYLFGKSVFQPDLELQSKRRAEALFYDQGKELQKMTPEDIAEVELAEKNIRRLEKEIADARDIPKGAPTGPDSPQARFIKRTEEKIAIEKKKIPEAASPDTRYTAMKEAINTLDENEQNIVKSVFGVHEDHSIVGEQDTAEIYGITRRRVNRIKNSALRKLELTEGVRTRAEKKGFDVKEGKVAERGSKRRSIAPWRAKDRMKKLLPKGKLAYEKTVGKTKGAEKKKKERFKLGRTLYEDHGIIARPYKKRESKAWAANIPGAWESDYEWAKANGFPPEPAPSAIKEGLPARKQEPKVSPKNLLKINYKKLKALEGRVAKQLKEEADIKETSFANELTAEELIAAFEATGEIPITASKGFQISNEVKQKVYGINRRLVAGEITKEQQIKEINKLLGTPRPWKELPALPTLDEIKTALGKKWNQGGKFIFGFGETLPEQTVQTRLDINAYRNHDTWVPTVHNTKGKVLAYGPTSHLTDVTFHDKNLEAYVKDSLNVATGVTDKFPFAMYQGKWKQHDPDILLGTAEDALKSNEWTQVGMNPLRHSFFYDRSTGKNNGRPVISANEVIQIGGVLLARGVKYGNVNDFKTTTFKGKKARPGKGEIKGSEGVPVTFSKAVDPVTWEGDQLQPGKINGIGTFTGEIVDAITKSGATDRALINSLIGEKFTRIPTDRFRTGTYKPLSDDPNHPFNKNPFFMRGGVGYTLIPENRAANAMWASDATRINGSLVAQVLKGIRHGLIYFMTPDSHFSNKAVWKIYETETDWMLSQGTIDRDRLNARIEEIIGKTEKKWKAIRGGLQKAKGKDNWEKLKNTIPGTTFDQRKPLLAWLGGNIMATGTVAETKAGIKKGFFSGKWDPETLEITELTKKTETFGAPLAQIYPRITQSPLAANFSVIGISKFHDTFFNKKTGKTEDIRNNITAEELGVTPHEAYEYILPGEDVAYIGDLEGGVDFNQAFAEYLPIRKRNALYALNNLTGELNFTDTMIDRLFGYTDRTGDYVSVRQLDGWDSIENAINKELKKQGVKSEDKRKTRVNEVVSHVNALRANKVIEIRKGFEMSSVPIPSVSPEVLGQFTTDQGAQDLYITASRSAAKKSKSSAATNATGRWGRWTNFVNRQIRHIRPLSKIKGEKLYLGTRQLVHGQLAKWEMFGKSVYKALANSKDTKAVYKYLTTPGASPTMIKNPSERIAAKKAKDAIESIGNALVKRGLLKKKTIEEFKAKYGDYLPRVYLMHLLDDDTRTKIASGSLKPSDMKYLIQRKDIPKALRELVFGELTDQPGAAAYLASRATMIPGKDIVIMDWMAKIKDLSLKHNLDWVLPKQFVTFNTMEELNDIAKKFKAESIAAQLELDGDLTNMSAEVTPMWLHTEGRRLSNMAGQFEGKADTKKRQIILELSQRMIKKAKKAEPVLSKEDAKMFKKLPDSKRYGQLRGMYVQKQIAFDIMGGAKIATGEESNMEKIFGDTGMMGKYNSYWKWAKVAANPPSWARNYMSNNILLTLAGVPMWKIPSLNIAAIRDFKNKGKYYKIALNQGVMSGNMSQAELGKLESDFIDVQRKMQKTQSPWMWSGGMLSKFMEKTSDIYGGLETISKIAAIKYGMENKGMNESQAAAFANKWLFDYGLVTPSVKYASTAVVGAPFIRFQSHAIPLMLEVMLTKPWRLAPYYAIGYGMAELFKNNHDLDEEQYKAAKKALAKWLQEKAVNGILPPAIIPMLSLDDQGRMQIYDISWVAPWGMLGEMASEVQNAQFVDAAKTLGLMGGPLPDMLAALKTGIDPFTRRPITDELKSNAEQIYDYLIYMTNLTTPSMLHTEYGAVSRAYDAITGKLDEKTGEPKFTGTQAALRLFGINIYPTDLVEQRKKNIRRMDWEISTVKAEWTRRRRGMRKSGASQEDIKEAREAYQEKNKEMTQVRRDYVRQSRVPQSLRAGKKT